MLEVDYLQQINSVLETVECQVKLPRAIFEQLSRTGVAPSLPDDNRRYIRNRIFSKAVLQVWQSLPSVERKPQSFSIFTKDQGLRSIGFFHSQQLYPGEDHFIFLNSGMMMKCTVDRCFRHNGQCFEVGSTVNDTEILS